MGFYPKNTSVMTGPVRPVMTTPLELERANRARMSQHISVDRMDAAIMDLLVGARARCGKRVHWPEDRRRAFGAFDLVVVGKPGALRWAK